MLGPTRQSTRTLREAIPDLLVRSKSQPRTGCFLCLSPVQRMCSTSSEHRSRRHHDDRDFLPTAGVDLFSQLVAVLKSGAVLAQLQFQAAAREDHYTQGVEEKTSVEQEGAGQRTVRRDLVESSRPFVATPGDE